jgi:adenosylhomocysteine nucleosidase
MQCKPITAIISALPQEQAGLLQALHDNGSAVASQLAGRTFWQGQLQGVPVALALSGMGKVAAATTATVLAERFGVQRMLFTGVAGGLGANVQVGDVVVASSYLQHDMDARPLALRWHVPGYHSLIWSCDPVLTQHLQRAAQSALDQHQAGFALTQQHRIRSSRPSQTHTGLVASGDQFVASAVVSTQLRADLAAAGHDVLAVEMEGAAVAQVCHDYGIAFAAVRTISDRADDDAHGDFVQFVHTVASPLATAMVMLWLGFLSSSP